MKRKVSKTGKVKSVLALTMAAAFLVTGCGKSSGDKKNDNNSTEQPTSSVVEEETVNMDFGLEGEEVKVNLKTNEENIDDNYNNYYEIFVGSFCDSDGDGMGDLQGVISKLDYLNDGDPNTDTDLGIDGIWFMPISPSPSYHKYDVVDYCAIDEAYGTMDDFKQLIEECDKRGIKIIIDLVMNHSSVANDWFKQARTYLKDLPADQEPNVADCKYIDYYTFVKSDTSPGSTYYTVASGTNYYYEGTFSQNMPELNLDNPDVRAEFEQIAKYWLDLGVSGFRLDAAKEFFSGNTERSTEVLRWFENYVTSVDENAYIVAETWTTDYDRYLDSGIESAFDFGYTQFDSIITTVAQHNMADYGGEYFTDEIIGTQELVSKYPNGISATFIGNHDLDRIAGYLAYSPEKIKFAHGLLSLMSGNIFIYYGDELGMGGSGADENKRAPMVWSTTDQTGMTNGPVNMDKSYVIMKFGSVEEQLADDTSILNYVKSAVKMRNTFPEIARGTIEQIDVDDIDIAAFSKTYNDSKIIVLANTSQKEAKCVNLSRADYGYTCIQGMLTVGSEQPYQIDDTVVIPPQGIVILK